MIMAKQSGNLTPLVLALLTGLLMAGCTTTEGPTAADGSPTPQLPAAPYNGMTALPGVDSDPQQLMGLDHTALNKKLGKPALIRRDGNAEIWQYRADRCVLDLFLYGVAKRVEHVDLRNRGDGSEGSVRNCFAGMLRAATPGT